jgi:predicted ATPase/DNA-binding winged helix-turn-helix (wHTH) protein
VNDSPAVNDPVEFRLLGPVEAFSDGVALPLGGPRQRALLALLLVDPGEPVSVDRLVDELWQGRPPPGAATTLRSYASRLRSVLGEAGVLTSGPAGYVLDVDPDRIDSSRFERLVREAEKNLAGGRYRRARQQLSEALLLWRGRPFGELADEGLLRSEAERLDQRRIEVLEQRIDVDLDLGAGTEVVEELELLVREHPYRERLWRGLMLALYRAERQADALATYRRAHEILGGVGLEPSQALRRLEQQILRHEVPGVARMQKRHSLPTPVTSFVGREAELAALARLLREARLVTLTGVGGVGKTRLALEAGRQALGELAAEVRFVDLSPVGDPSAVTRTVAAAFGLADEHDTPLEDVLAAQLRDEELLLLLDNCEHVRDACAALATVLLERCPLLQILATSREQLPIAGAVDFAVPPLALPPLDASDEELRAAESVRLLLTRAREARLELDEDAALASAVAICNELDGLPLAIELAAARTKVLTLEEIAERLADRFRFLVSWRRLTAARHRTLREAMDWSYELLTADEQQLLACLAVFAGGFTIEAVASVCCDGREDVALERVERLVDASLIVAEEREGRMRYRLLETVRQYAEERLAETGGAADVRSKHAAWCVEFAEQAQSRFAGSQQSTWFEVVEREQENLRAALAHGGDASDGTSGLRLAVALARYWYVRGHLNEGREWLERTLEASGPHPPELDRRALTAAASLALLQGDYGVATSLAERALEAARAGGQPVFLANALSNLGAIVLAAGDNTRAQRLLEEAAQRARAAGDRRVQALAVNNLGDLLLTTGDYAEAEPLFEESLGLLRELGDTANVARSLFNLGAVALSLGRPADAERRFLESIALAEDAGDKEDLAWCLEGFAGLAASAGDGERAARLLGAAGGLLAEIGADFKPFERQLDERTRSEAVALCGQLRFEAALAEGVKLSLAAALALARA